MSSTCITLKILNAVRSKKKLSPSLRTNISAPRRKKSSKTMTMKITKTKTASTKCVRLRLASELNSNINNTLKEALNLMKKTQMRKKKIWKARMSKSMMRMMTTKATITSEKSLQN